MRAVPLNGEQRKSQKGQQKETLQPLRLQGFIWQREKDSNPHKQSQSLSCYPYTIPLGRAGFSQAQDLL